MTHIMLDLETLDTAPTAVILSIGMAVFDPDIGKVIKKHYIKMGSRKSIDVQLKRFGRTISAGTLHWWLAQEREAQAVFTESEMENSGYRMGLTDAWDFIRSHETPHVWGNGADFDNVILAHALQSDQMAIPWHHRNSRCYRTITGLGIGPRRPVFKGIKHNALDDAVNQAEHLMEVLACLNSNSSSLGSHR